MGTESEIASAQDDAALFASAMSDDQNEVEAPELKPETVKDEGEGKETEVETDADEGEGDEPETETQTEPRRREPRIPLARLNEESNKRRDAEVENATLKERNASLEQRLIALERQPQQRAEPVAPAEVPDPLNDPEGYAAHVHRTIRNEMVRDKVASSFEDAHDAHGEKFVKAYDLIQQVAASGDAQTRDRIIFAPNPGKALMKWFGEREAQREIGGDISAYRDRVKSEATEALKKDPEFRKALLAELRGEAETQPGRTRVDLPSLNGASGARVNDADPGSDKELLSSLMPRR